MSDSVDISIDEIFSKKNLTDIKKPLATVHIALSSENQEPQFENTPMTWKLDLSNSRSKGSISTMAPLSNLYHMKISDFIICYVGSEDGTGKYDKRNVHLLIEEFAQQSFIGPPNYHFAGFFLKAKTDSRTRLQFYDYNRGDFYFTRVIEVINSFTLRLYNPFQELVTPRQIRYAYVVNNSSPLQLQFTSKHYMSFTPIIITEFQSSNAALNAAINNNSFEISAIPNDKTITINYSPGIPYTCAAPVVTNFRKFGINVPIQLDYLYE